MIIQGNPRKQRNISERWRKAGKTIGLVPTMGALHEGHLSLVRASLASHDRTVVSIFVNPSQFGPKEDLKKYPRPFSRDCTVLRGMGVDSVFHPSPAMMYPRGFSTSVEVGGSLTRGLCAPRRPGHFRGVATVVAKLFNIIRPDSAFFGAKDFQQASVIRRMASDLNMGVAVRVLPTVRERDGLAKSSRNACLSVTERQVATVLSRALRAGAGKIASGKRQRAAVLAAMRVVLAQEPLVRVEYLEITDAGTLAPVSRLKGRVLMALAVRVGGTRLIDNISVRVPTGRSRRKIRR